MPFIEGMTAPTGGYTRYGRDPRTGRYGYWVDAVEARPQEAPTMTTARPATGWNVSSLQRMTAEELRDLSERHSAASRERARMQGRSNMPLAPFDDELTPEEQAAVLAVGLQRTTEQADAEHAGALELLRKWDDIEQRIGTPDRQSLDQQARSEALAAMTRNETKIAGLTEARRDSLADLMTAAGLTEADING